jgi:hypothetical protein
MNLHSFSIHPFLLFRGFHGLWVLCFLASCSHQKLVVRLSDGLLDTGSIVFDEESDLDFLAASLPANIKLMEALLVSDPENEILLENIAKAYYAYGFVVWEEAYLAGAASTESSRNAKSKANLYYERAQDFSQRYLLRHDPLWEKVWSTDEAQFAKLLGNLDEVGLRLLFWYASSLGQQIQLRQDEMALVAKLPRVVSMMHAILEWDDSYYFGAPHLFMAVYFASRPAMLGGDLKKASEHFKRAREIGGDQLTLVDVYYAQFYATQSMDRKAFDKSIQAALAPNIEAPKKMALLIAVARKKAARLKTQADELF